MGATLIVNNMLINYLTLIKRVNKEAAAHKCSILFKLFKKNP